jgi:hypothetical protein
VKRINLSFIAVEIPQGDVKPNSYVLRDARSNEAQWILCSAPTFHKINDRFIDQSSLKLGAILSILLT